MRHDLTETRPGVSAPIPLKWFTWGYELHDSRWWLYWRWRLPGRSWEIYHDWRIDSHKPCWCAMVVSYRAYGFRDDFGRGKPNRWWDWDYIPIERFT